MIPVYREILADFETPLSAYRKIRSGGEAFLCESVEGGEHLSRYSFVGCNPRGIIRQDGDQVQVVEDGKVTAQGKHHDLLRKGGLYARLADLQFGREAAE